jgi:hypothetical protein
MNIYDIVSKVDIDQVKKDGKTWFKAFFQDENAEGFCNNLNLEVFINVNMNSSIDEINKKGMQAIKDFVSKVHLYVQKLE